LEQEGRIGDIERIIKDIEKQLTAPARPHQGGNDNKEKLQERAEAVRNQLQVRREWKSLLQAEKKLKDLGNEQRRFKWAKENWERYKPKYQKWEDADKAVKEWNRARDAWVETRRTKDGLSGEVNSLMTSVEESLATEEKKIKAEITKREKAKGDALHKRLRMG